MITVRGKAKINWKPNYTILAESTDGLSLDNDGEAHDLVVTLTNTADSTPVANRTIKLQTVAAGRVGDGVRKVTNSAGQVTFRVSNTTAESVEYTASLVPVPATSLSLIEDVVTIQWGSGYYLFVFPSDSTSASGADFGPVDMALSTTDAVYTAAVGVSITVSPIGVIGVTDGTGHLLFMLPDHAAGAVVYELTVPTLSSGVSSVPNTFTHTWT